MTIQDGFNQIVKTASQPIELQAVLEIYRDNKQELGFMPDGAFEQRFKDGHLLVVLVDQIVAGYLMFWVNQRSEVRVAHLVGAEVFRGIGS